MKHSFKQFYNETKSVSVIDTSTTEMHHYDNLLQNPDFAEYEGWKAEITTMTPDEYIELCAKGFKSSEQSVLSNRDPEKVAKMVTNMQKGIKYPLPILVYSYNGSFTQEGLHRAMAAKELGVTEYPVAVFKELD